jgi:epoxide hydrolase 4
LKQAVLANANADDISAYVAAWSQPGALTGGLNYYRAARVGPPALSAATARVEGPATTASGDAGRGRSLDRPATERSEDRSLPDVVVRVPTLVIWGEKDTALLTGNLEGLEQVVPSLTVKRIPDGTHWVVRERANEVNALIREFLAPK